MLLVSAMGSTDYGRTGGGPPIKADVVLAAA
jgi:hypothetical protein